MQALESMEEKGMQGDPRYAQLMNMANRYKNQQPQQGMSSYLHTYRVYSFDQPPLEKMFISRQASLQMQTQFLCFCVQKGTISLQIPIFPDKEFPKFPTFSHCVNQPEWGSN